VIIDFHTHIGKSLLGYSQTAQKLIKNMDKSGISKAVICPVKHCNYRFEPQNDFIANMVSKYPEKFIGFCRIDPWQGEKAKRELKRCIEKLKMKGLFLHPWEEIFPINEELVVDLVKVADEYQIPVMISGGHLRVSRAWQISDLVRQFPETNFIITSGGQINISGMGLAEATEMLAENPNTIMETSGIYREDFIEETVQKFGKERVLFGSNAPEYNQQYEVMRALWAHLSPEEIEFMTFRNAAKLLNLKY